MRCAELFGVETSRFLDCLEIDFARLRAVVPTDPSAAVPSCPGRTVADLTRHLGEMYLHKTLAMREGVEPEPWHMSWPRDSSTEGCTGDSGARPSCGNQTPTACSISPARSGASMPRVT